MGNTGGLGACDCAVAGDWAVLVVERFRPGHGDGAVNIGGTLQAMAAPDQEPAVPPTRPATWLLWVCWWLLL